jgi:hypothetical protein
MAYTTIKKPSDYFNTKLYTGNGTARIITGVGFQPDWSWFKSRGDTNSHALYDAVRGVTKAISSNSTGAEATESQGLTSFDSDGFSIGSQTAVNASGHGIVSWNWKANGTGSSNTDGSISSTVSANTTSGFSIVSSSGSNSNSTVGDGLGVAPKVIIIKRLNTADNWRVLHMSAGNDNTAHLNLTSSFSSSAVFQNTSPTSTVFSLVGNNTSVNQSGSTYIAYCFADVTGYSKFGSYVGNGNANGTFVYTGFKPAFVILKASSAAGQNWMMFDNKRNEFNVMNKKLYADNNLAEETSDYLDFTSNGYKLKTTSSDGNGSGTTYIYMAFAEAPLVGTNNVPANAR